MSWREHTLHFNMRLMQELQKNPFTAEIFIFCVLVKICRSLLMENNVKFVLNDVKARAFSGSKRRDIRASILVPLASQSNVARNAV